MACAALVRALAVPQTVLQAVPVWGVAAGERRWGTGRRRHTVREAWLLLLQLPRLQGEGAQGEGAVVVLPLSLPVQPNVISRSGN